MAEEVEGSGPGKDPEQGRRRREALEVNPLDMGTELDRNPKTKPRATGTENQGGIHTE